MMRRLLEASIAGAGLAAAAPVLALAAIAIKLDSTGPVLFAQHRVGRAKQPFKLFKLRTMTVQPNRDGPAITAAHDGRITRVGRILRRTKLDEVPQLWNVVRGEMSLVGPRPEVPRYVERYTGDWLRLLEVRPGVTDLASLTFRREEELLATARDRERAYAEVIMPLKLGLALRGMERSSLLHDAGIIIKTALSIFGLHKEDTVIAEAMRRIEAMNDQEERA